MSVNNALELANTLAKLARLEARYETLRNVADGNQRVRELSMISLKRLINQFKEEIARYERISRSPLMSSSRLAGIQLSQLGLGRCALVRSRRARFGSHGLVDGVVPSIVTNVLHETRDVRAAAGGTQNEHDRQ